MPSAPNACGTARATMNIAVIAANIAIRARSSSGSMVLVSQL